MVDSYEETTLLMQWLQGAPEAGILYIPVAEQLRGGAEIFGDICHLRNPGIEAKAAIIADAFIDAAPMR